MNRSKPAQKWIGSLLAALLLAACTNPFNGSQNTQPKRNATLAKGELVATVSATGNIQAEAEIDLDFQINGKVTEVKVEKGDKVKKGDVLARLDTFDLQAAVAQAHAGLVIATAAYSRTIEAPRAADIEAAQAAVDAAYANYGKLQGGPQSADIAAVESSVRSAEAALRQAESIDDLTRKYNTQNYPGSPTITQVEQARNNLESARLQYDRVIRGADKAQMVAAFQQVQAARAQLERVKQTAKQYEIDQALANQQNARIQVLQAQRRLEQAVLVAPDDAMVGAVNLQSGESHNRGAQPAIVLIDTSILHIDVTVDEIDVARVRPGQDVAVTLDALPGVELKGSVDTVASTSTLVNGVVSYAVRVVIAKTEASLRAGMTANATIVLDKRANVLLSPNWAIRRDRQNNKSFLTIKIDDKTSQEVEVKTGLRNDAFSEILVGAQEGQVVLAPVTPNLLAP